MLLSQKMPQVSGPNMPKPKPIPLPNKWKYSMMFRQVYESAKLDKRDLVELCCRSTHCVHLRYEDFDENNELYTICGKHAGQEVSFMRKWLHFFIMEAYRK